MKPKWSETISKIIRKKPCPVHKNESTRHKRPLSKRSKIVLFVLAVPACMVAIAIIAIYTYVLFQKPTQPNQSLLLQNKLTIPTLAQPRLENGEKVFDLTAQQSQLPVLPGKQTTVLGYNGGYLGPTFRVSAGDRIRVHITNSLTVPTTVHWHGMHLPAVMDGGPHQVIKAGAKWDPYWTIANEASTLWYHSHLMGMTGEQTYRGLAGMFLVDDKNSDALDLPKEYGVDDLPLIVQDRKFDKDNQLVYESQNRDDLGCIGMLGDKILVNGTYAPYADVPAKQVRFRILNASNARRFKFGFNDNRSFHQIASDGGLLESPVALTRMTLSPGERAEIVVDFTNNTKPVTLISDAIHEDSAMMRFWHVFVSNRDQNQVFQILELRPQPTITQPVPLPKKLNAIRKLTPDMAIKTRRFLLDYGSRTINGKRMEDERVDAVVHSGAVEIWDVRDETGTYHPFHIHAVQFQIISRDGERPEPYEQGWKDTILIHNSETVRLIMKFPEFSDSHNPYMYHCHILEHEDMGMMGQFVVVSKDTKAQDIRVKATMHGGDRMDMKGMD